VRILVVHAELHLRKDESSEIYESVSGLTRAAHSHGASVFATDGRRLYEAQLDAFGGLSYIDTGGFLRAWLQTTFDVAHVQMVVPYWHLAIAVLLFMRRTPIVLTPMSMLGDDFMLASWFRHKPRHVSRVLKPSGVRALRLAWRAVARAFIVQSHAEAAFARLPPQRCSYVPLPAPRSELGAAAGPASPPSAVDPSGPVAFISRFDPWRKGMDRMCRWLEAYADRLPRPAAVLFAPDDGQSRPAQMTALIDQGVLRWDPVTRGVELGRELGSCRGVMLLSRWDGQPRVLREAALLGLPTMSTPASHFTDVVDALGCGLIVDGDDPADVQDGYERLASQSCDGFRAQRLFDRDRIGAFLYQVLVATAAGVIATEDYYSAFVSDPAGSP
jgi:glycosyltransferase involved in cell wall biosynthesis